MLGFTLNLGSIACEGSGGTKVAPSQRHNAAAVLTAAAVIVLACDAMRGHVT